MPWEEKTVVQQRKELVEEILAQGKSIAEISRNFGVSRQTAYKWCKRHLNNEGMEDRSRKPLKSPSKTDDRVEELVLEERNLHPCGGPRKLKKRLENKGYEEVPAASTIAAILKRNDRINPQESAKHRPFQRFQREAPNELWQADFIGDYLLGNSSRCYPLSVIDDASRYELALDAKARQGTPRRGGGAGNVRQALFRAWPA